MTAAEVRQVRQALLDGVARLVAEFEDYPAGVVMRCYSRAVREARLMGHPSPDLPEEVERRTRAMLLARRTPAEAHLRHRVARPDHRGRGAAPLPR